MVMVDPMLLILRWLRLAIHGAALAQSSPLRVDLMCRLEDGTVDYYEKHILGPESEVWFKIVYTSGWWDWYLALSLLGLARLV